MILTAHLHPIIVHAPLALWPTVPVFYGLAIRAAGSPRAGLYAAVGTLNLLLGTVASVLAVLSGLLAVSDLSVVGIAQATLIAGSHRHPHGRRQALPEGTGRGFDTGRVSPLRVPGSERSGLAEVLEVIEFESVAAQEQLDVEREAAVTARQYEAIAPQPGRIGRIVTQEPLEDQIGGRGEGHRGSGVTMASLLHCIGGEHPSGVNGTTVKFGPVQGGHSVLLIARCGFTLAIRVRPWAA